TEGAAASATRMPALVDPVKETRSISGCVVIALPTVGPSPVTKLNTPFGKWAACRTSASTVVLIDVNSLGFTTTVQPAANAADSLVESIWIGQFQGVIRPQTPIDSRLMTLFPRSVSNSYPLRVMMACLNAASAVLVCIFRLFGA